MTVAYEENEVSSMIGRLRRPHKRNTGREPQKNYLWSWGGSLFGTETSRSASLTVFDVAEVSIEDPSSSLAEPSYSKAFIKSTHQISNSNCSPYRHSLCVVTIARAMPKAEGHLASIIFVFTSSFRLHQHWRWLIYSWKILTSSFFSTDDDDIFRLHVELPSPPTLTMIEF